MAVNKYTPEDEEIEFFRETLATEPEYEKRYRKGTSIALSPVKGLLKESRRARDEFEQLSEQVPFFGDTFKDLNIELDLAYPNRQKSIDELIPTSQGVAESAGERIGKLFPWIASGPAGALGGLLRSALGGISGELGKRFFGEKGELLGEIIGSSGPDIAQRIPLTARNQDVGEYARNILGVEEGPLATILENENPVRRAIGSIANRGGRVTNAFQRGREELNRAWNTLTGRVDAQHALNSQQSQDLITDLANRMQNLPAGMRNAIQEDFNDLLNSQMRGTDVINFWQDINWNNARENLPALGTLKAPLDTALEQISPNLSRDFTLTNTLHSNFARNSQRMSPRMADTLIKAGEIGTFVHGLITGNYPEMAAVLGTVAARELAAEMIINPRFQNMTARLLTGLQRGSPVTVKRGLDQLINELSKSNSEAAKAMSKIDINSILDSYKE